MNRSLESYLHHHLQGFSRALVLFDSLTSRDALSEDHHYFRSMSDEVLGERNFLLGLLESAGLYENKMVDYPAPCGGRKNPASDHSTDDTLIHLEMLESLILGIQGKRLMWKALQAIHPRIPGWKNVDFTQLERSSVRQRDGLETRRLHHVQTAFRTLLAQAS
ncbi:MAG: hypothetical protein QM627_00815 [Luteolibacter sp.]